MTISFNLPPVIVNALEAHLQRAVRPATINGNTVLVPIFPSIEAFFQSVLGQVFEGLLRQYRPEPITQKLNQIESLENEVRMASLIQITRS